MCSLQQGDHSAFLEQLKEVVTKYPKNEISELAGLIAQGMQEGRLLASGSLGDIWSRRLTSMNDAAVVDSLRPTFSDEQFVPFTFVLAYEEGTLNDNQLLFEMARYNFTKFMVRNFEIVTSKHGGVSMLYVKGLRSFAEAYQYMHHLYADAVMATKLSGIRALLISDENLDLLLKHYSIEEYIEFYETHFMGYSTKKDAKDDLDVILFE
jgi:hypothetical protein